MSSIGCARIVAPDVLAGLYLSTELDNTPVIVEALHDNA